MYVMIAVVGYKSKLHDIFNISQGVYVENFEEWDPDKSLGSKSDFGNKYVPDRVQIVCYKEVPPDEIDQFGFDAVELILKTYNMGVSFRAAFHDSLGLSYLKVFGQSNFLGRRGSQRRTHMFSVNPDDGIIDWFDQYSNSGSMNAMDSTMNVFLYDREHA
jgi:hypothetical protein